MDYLIEPSPETFADKLLGFTLPTRGARGRVVRVRCVIAAPPKRG